MEIVIKTDHKWRPFKTRNEVSKRILNRDFDYQSEDIWDGYFRYRRTWYHLDQFVNLDSDDFPGWNGICHQGFAAGVVIKVSDNCVRYQVGYYYVK